MFQARILSILILLTAFAFTACGGTVAGTTAGGGITPADPFATATTPGDVVTVTAGSATFKMIYANSSATGIVFPTGTGDAGTATISKKFFMGETAVTNVFFAAVLQWAKDHGKFSTTVGDHNGLDSTTAKYGAQELIDLNYGADMKISYASGTFSVTSGYENYPVVCVSWYGAIMFCNWLTEMTDGNTTNVVYSGIDATWLVTETVETATKTGYRLPSSDEWEYAARYIGSTAPTTGNLTTEVVYYNKGPGSFLTLTSGYYWTPGDYASGATKDNTNFTECDAVAWFGNSLVTGTGNTTSLQLVAQKTANALGLRDMSGNVSQWCFTNGALCAIKGGSWYNSATGLQVGFNSSNLPNNLLNYLGFRFARTQ